MRHDDESPYAKSGGDDHHSGRIATRLLFRDADNVRSSEPAELANRVEDAKAGRGSTAAKKCCGNVVDNGQRTEQANESSAGCEQLGEIRVRNGGHRESRRAEEHRQREMPHTLA